jgi:hypothetical protein
MTKELFLEQFKALEAEENTKEALQKLSPAPELIAVEGKQGWMKNPFDPDGPLIDVRGIPSGTLIRDFKKNQSYRIPKDYPPTHPSPQSK